MDFGAMVVAKRSHPASDVMSVTTTTNALMYLWTKTATVFQEVQQEKAKYVPSVDLRSFPANKKHKFLVVMQLNDLHIVVV